jgi:hypothetical protein
MPAVVVRHQVTVDAVIHVDAHLRAVDLRLVRRHASETMALNIERA